MEKCLICIQPHIKWGCGGHGYLVAPALISSDVNTTPRWTCWFSKKLPSLGQQECKIDWLILAASKTDSSSLSVPLRQSVSWLTFAVQSKIITLPIYPRETYYLKLGSNTAWSVTALFHVVVLRGAKLIKISMKSLSILTKIILMFFAITEQMYVILV